MSLSFCELSIIIPCYNHGVFLREALDSIVKDEILYTYEIIVVDDGSTDEFTLAEFKELTKEGYQIIHQKNMGLGGARNTGIANAKGKYILSLDADNKITSDYINKSIPILDKGNYHIIHCSPAFFGDTTDSSRFFTSKPFDIVEIMAHNYIDNCVVFNKQVWKKNNGYETNMPYNGHEDWEFWINAYRNGFKFYYLPEKLFYYRVVANSMIEQFKDTNRFKENYAYIVKKHASLYALEFVKLEYIKKKYNRDINRFLISPFIFIGYKMGLLKTPFKKADERFKATF
jgi:glycosyltransferase involved in cell wall biosynthesis